MARKLNIEQEGLNDPKLLTQAEVESHFGISQRTLEYWRYRGYGPNYHKIGRLTFYRPKDVEDFINQHYIRVPKTPSEATK